jgi:hypothetical protein
MVELYSKNGITFGHAIWCGCISRIHQSNDELPWTGFSTFLSTCPTGVYYAMQLLKAIKAVCSYGEPSFNSIGSSPTFDEY